MLTGLIILAFQDPLEVLREADGQAAIRALLGRGEEIRSVLVDALPALEEPARGRAEMVIQLLDWQPPWPRYTVTTRAGRVADTLIALRAAGVPTGRTLNLTDVLFLEAPDFAFQDAGAADILDELWRRTRLDLTGRYVPRRFCAGPYGVAVYPALPGEEPDGEHPPGPRFIMAPWILIRGVETCGPARIASVTAASPDGGALGVSSEEAGAPETCSDPIPEWAPLDSEPGCPAEPVTAASFGLEDAPAELASVSFSFRGWLEISTTRLVETAWLCPRQQESVALSDWTVAVAAGALEAIRISVDGPSTSPHVHVIPHTPSGALPIAALRIQRVGERRWLLWLPPFDRRRDIELEIRRMEDATKRRLYFEVSDVPAHR